MVKRSHKLVLLLTLANLSSCSSATDHQCRCNSKQSARLQLEIVSEILTDLQASTANTPSLAQLEQLALVERATESWRRCLVDFDEQAELIGMASGRVLVDISAARVALDSDYSAEVGRARTTKAATSALEDAISELASVSKLEITDCE